MTFIFPYWEESSQLTFIFFRGVVVPLTSFLNVCFLVHVLSGATSLVSTVESCSAEQCTCFPGSSQLCDFLLQLLANAESSICELMQVQWLAEMFEYLHCFGHLCLPLSVKAQDVDNIAALWSEPF